MSQSDSPHKSVIKLDIGLDDKRIPERIKWSSSDGPQGQPSQENNCEAFMLSVWDAKVKESLRIDLWTKEMQRDEMDLFFFQTIVTMADTYARANGNDEVAGMIRDFGFKFGEKTNLVMRQQGAAPGPGETPAEGILPNPPGGGRPTTPDDILPSHRPSTPDDTLPTTPDTLG